MIGCQEEALIQEQLKAWLTKKRAEVSDWNRVMTLAQLSDDRASLLGIDSSLKWFGETNQLRLESQQVAQSSGKSERVNSLENV